MNRSHAKLTLSLAMAVFGTIGLFRRAIPLSSGLLALLRGVIGMAFLLVFSLLRGHRLAWVSLRAQGGVLLLSGAFIGANWILLFEAYRFTTVATATLCYYMAPVFVMLAAPFVLREKLTARRAFCIAGAFLGMVFVSGLPRAGLGGIGSPKGILLGLGAALLYACVILLNQFLREVPALDKTIVQLGAASLVLVPYELLADRPALPAPGPALILAVAVVGVVHTGIAYLLYFGSMEQLPAQTVALFGYIDPVVAILLSALLLHEPMGSWEAAGAALVLCSTLVSELPERKSLPQAD